MSSEFNCSQLNIQAYPIQTLVAYISPIFSASVTQIPSCYIFLKSIDCIHIDAHFLHNQNLLSFKFTYITHCFLSSRIQDFQSRRNLLLQQIVEYSLLLHLACYLFSTKNIALFWFSRKFIQFLYRPTKL